jgi:uncharacterized peroxidase-related enzyme
MAWTRSPYVVCVSGSVNFSNALGLCMPSYRQFSPAHDVMTWITTVPYDAAQGRLKTLYDRIKGPDDNIDNIMMTHSLRPHTMVGHMTRYKHVLHNPANQTSNWLLEALGVYVSILNGCAYCSVHHFQGMRHLLADDERAEAIRSALEVGKPERVFDDKATVAMFDYARRLTADPKSVTEQAIEAMHSAGVSDGEILEINQVVSYFSYAHRTVVGLGISTDGDIIGLAPSGNDADDWSHQ